MTYTHIVTRRRFLSVGINNNRKQKKKFYNSFEFYYCLFDEFYRKLRGQRGFSRIFEKHKYRSGGVTHVGPCERYVAGTSEHEVFNDWMAAHVVGGGHAPYAEQLLAGVHDAYAAADDHAKREQPEQHADWYGRQLQPVKRLHSCVLFHVRTVVEVQPVLDQHVLRPGRSRRRRLQLRRYRRRVLLLQHADLQPRVVHLAGDLV